MCPFEIFNLFPYDMQKYIYSFRTYGKVKCRIADVGIFPSCEVSTGMVSNQQGYHGLSQTGKPGLGAVHL